LIKFFSNIWNYYISYFISVIKYLFTGKEMLYEKLSKTRLVSTIKLNSSDISCTK